MKQLASRSTITQGMKLTTGAASRIIAGRIILLFAGMGATLILLGLQILIWMYSLNPLELWFERCAFGRSPKKSWSPEQEEAEFKAALKEMGWNVAES